MVLFKYYGFASTVLSSVICSERRWRTTWQLVSFAATNSTEASMDWRSEIDLCPLKTRTLFVITLWIYTHPSLRVNIYIPFSSWIHLYLKLQSLSTKVRLVQTRTSQRRNAMMSRRVLYGKRGYISYWYDLLSRKSNALWIWCKWFQTTKLQQHVWHTKSILGRTQWQIEIFKIIR